LIIGLLLKLQENAIVNTVAFVALYTVTSSFFCRKEAAFHEDIVIK
jgi:hypothetical protein